jgi:signal transduction histidine kinase/CheY-like chemotaxis protein
VNISEPHLRRVQRSSEEAPPESGSELERTHAGEQEEELAGALHEVSNALTVVLGWLSTLRSEPLAPHVRQALEVAEQHARRGHNVARSAIGAAAMGSGISKADARSVGERLPSDSHLAGAMDIARPDVDDGEVKLRNVQSLLQDVLTAVRPAASEKGIRLHTQRDGGTEARDELVAGGDALLQVLVNLVLNAIAYSPRRGVVRVTASAGPGRVVFAVADQGPGVPPAQQKRLFERGHSLRPGGAGIGLSHSRSLAIQNGGGLGLARNQGGATFEVTWPTRELPSQTICKAPFLQGTKVLVLEDDDAVMEMVRFGLESRGAQVFHAANLAEVAVLTSVHRDFALALLDLSPINGAYDLATKELRRSQSALPLIPMSGSANAGQADLDAAAWVKKPFELSELYDTLQSVLANQVSANRS